MEAPMESGGRVTRALRKRLTSVDSDNGSSRPGTPVMSKLAAPNDNSPLKPRTSRRNSITGVNTPVKTPVKRSGTPVIARTTRQRTASNLENEATSTKEKKVSLFDSLMEEEGLGPTTRSKSKSPIDQKVRAATTTISTRGRKSIVQSQSPNSKQIMHEKTIDSELNDKENNTDMLNAARQKLNFLYKGTSLDDAKPLPNDNDGQRIDARQRPSSLATISSLTEQLSLSEEPNVSHSMQNSLPNDDVNAELEKIFGKDKEDQFKDDIGTHNPDTLGQQTSSESTLTRSEILAALEEEDEDCVVYGELIENEKKVMLESQDEGKMREDIPKPAQSDIAPNKNADSGSLTFNEDEDVETDSSINNNINKLEFSLTDSADEITKETNNINAENVISTNPDKSPKYDQVDVAITKKIGSSTLALNDDGQNEDINRDSAVNNKSSSEGSLNDNADEPKNETANINAEDVISINPDKTPKYDHVDIATTKKIGSSTLALNDDEQNEDINRDSPVNNKSSSEGSLNDNADEPNNETGNINAENIISTNADKSPKYDQVDVATTKKIGLSTLALNDDEQNEDLNRDSPVNNESSSEGSLNDNANEPNNETENINADNVISTSLEPESIKLDNVHATTPVCNVKLSGNRDQDSLKVVSFPSNYSDDECVKKSYPKTPASAKKISFGNNKTDDKTLQVESRIDRSIISVQDTTEEEIWETQQEEVMSTQCATKTIAEDNTSDGEIISTQCATKTIAEDNTSDGEIISTQCATNTIAEDNKSNGEIMSTQCATKTIAEDNTSNTSSREKSDDDEPDLVLKWLSPSVKAKCTDLDIIGKCEKTVTDIDASVHVKTPEKTLQIATRNDSSESEEEEERENYFIDEEAMDVDDDYLSGDSLRSDVFRYLTRNEIPVQYESLGSNTTDQNSEDSDWEKNSFLVSDDEVEESSSDIGTKVQEAKGKPTYKRLKRVFDTSSDEDDSALSENNVTKCNVLSPAKQNDTSTVQNTSKTEELKETTNNSLNLNTLSDTALQLQQKDIKDSEDASVEGDVKRSRKEILRELNHSDHFNKSVRDLNIDVDVSPDNVPIIKSKNRDSDVEQKSSASGFVTKADLKSHFAAEVSGNMHKSEHEQDHPMTGGDSVEEVDDVQDQVKAEAKQGSALSVSFGNFKQQQKEKALQKEVLQQSFTIGVSINDGELETEVIQKKNTMFMPVPASPASPSSSPTLSSNEDTDGDILSSADACYLENVKNMPLGNPLVRTRRQSLALPTNPDMEIGPLQHGSTKLHKRKSLAATLPNDFNPSQSFIDSVQLRKAELERQTSKRKRLSKSFGGTTGDTSVVDIDVSHLHKRSKLSMDNSFVESFGNAKTEREVVHSSTPHEKRITKQLSNSGAGRILSRCDEILEAANRAQLEAKLNYQKSKIRHPKKNKKFLQKNDMGAVAPISKEIRKKEKTKIAVRTALKASANIIMGQQQKVAVETKKLPQEDDLKPRVNCRSVAERNKKEEQLVELKLRSRKCFSTSAGNVVETLQSPERKKKPKIIRLPTGNVYVEPISPARRTITSCSGMIFYESPISVDYTFCNAPSANSNNGQKRKRRIFDGGKQSKFSNRIWSASGTFMEDETPGAQRPHCVSQARISKTAQRQANNTKNFIESAINRGDIKK